jgi:hypothetical protein
LRISVVFPDPRKPVSTVIGVGASGKCVTIFNIEEENANRPSLEWGLDNSKYFSLPAIDEESSNF